MTSPPVGRAFVASVSPGVGSVLNIDRRVRQGFDSHRLQSGRSLEVAMWNGADQRVADTAKEPARILVVDAALALQESHLLLLRSIPAIVEILPCCAEMYTHEDCGYALVILSLQCQSKETTGAADFVRHRWNTARILLLKDEPAMIDDWLYDERIDPCAHPETVCEMAIRLLA
jgi:hypothetical protein